MVRQYRIDRFNGMEILVCECFSRHIFSSLEQQAFSTYNDEHPGAEVSQSEFRVIVNEKLSEDGVEEFAGLRYPIPLYGTIPDIILRGPVVDNRIVSLQVEYAAYVMHPSVCDEIWKFYQVMESRHWRDTIDHQIEAYGSLFATEDD